ncbi:hypothetical protein ACFS32_20705 [Novosphingobium pokkalii]|uniref:hypothetical protein n=1 Tax=Novosphingobium pokkalii TaxID=1770194 RepID=UPI00363FB659
MIRAPFLLLDDARQGDDGSARLYENPVEIVVARREDEVAAALERIAATPGWWAGALAYEAGLALEARLAPRAAARSGAAGPLVWFARFARMTPLTSAGVATWLAAESGDRSGAADGSARLARPIRWAAMPALLPRCRRRSAPGISIRPT